MSRLESARTELRELNDLIARFEAAHPPEWSGEWMSLQSLLQRQVEVLQEVHLLEQVGDLRVTLSGGAERAHWIDVNVFGTLLTRLQSTVAAVTQVVTLGGLRDEGSRGQLPRSVVETSTLSLGAMVPGSFSVVMDGPRDRITQVTMDAVLAGQEPLPAFDQAVLKVMDVLDAAGADAGPQTLPDAVAQIGSDRALNRLRELVSTLAGSGTSATIERRDPFGGVPREVHVTAVSAGQIEQILTTTVQTTTTIERVGILSGVRWRYGNFDLDIRLDDGSQESLSGHVATELRDTIRPWFDHVVRAQLEVTTTRLTAQRERVTYRLVGIEPIA